MNNALAAPSLEYRLSKSEKAVWRPAECINWMSAFLGRDHGWGQQRVATRLGNQRTQAAGNCGGLPLSVAGMRPSKTGTICYWCRCEQGHFAWCYLASACNATNELLAVHKEDQ